MLGSGAAGSVYLARRQGEQRTWALKVLGVTLSATTRERFEREAKLLAQLEHPGLARCLEAGMDPVRNQPFLVLEYIHGRPLEEFAAQPLAPEVAARLVADLADAVGYAHGRGVIHRDIKPENVVVREADGRPVLIDFGLARQLDTPSELTGEGDIVGTPHYMAPEQVEGDRKHTDARTDVYALGALLYRLLVGRPPFDAASLLDLCEAIQRGGPQPPRRLNPAVPGWLERVCLQALAVSPGERFPTAYALARALRGPQEFTPTRRRIPRAWLALAALTALALPLGWLVAGLLPRADDHAANGTPLDAAPSPTPVDAAPPPTGTEVTAGEAPAASPPDAAATQDEARLLAAVDAAPLELAPYLALARWRLAQGDLIGAGRALDQARDLGGDEAALRELRAAFEREQTLQRELNQRIHTLRDRFELTAALELARRSLEERPRSSNLHVALTRLLVVGGDPREALAHLRQAFWIDPRLPADPRLGDLRLVAQANETDDHGLQNPLWERWSPSLSGIWSAGDDGWITARGEGLGPYCLAGVVAGEPRATPRWQTSVEVDLGPDSKAYAGLQVAVEVPDEAYLVYVFSDLETLARVEGPDAARAYRREHGGDPTWVRVARLAHGDWMHVDTRPVRFDRAQPVRLTAEADAHRLTVAVNGETVDTWELERDLVGRVGLIKFFTAAVRFRNFELQ